MCIRDRNNTPDKLINKITETLNIITKQNYFTYNNKYYTQNHGLTMGSPISSILAEVFLQHLEKTKILTNNDRHSHKILYWHRYADDILILYRGNKRQYEQLLTVSYTHLDVYKRQVSNETISLLNTREEENVSFFQTVSSNIQNTILYCLKKNS